MTSAQHLKAARQAREAAHLHDVASHLAAERGDTIGAFEQLSEHHFQIVLAVHHEAQAAALVAPSCFCPGAACNVCRAAEEAEIEGLTNGPVHLIPTNTSGGQAIST